jgi:hypothetical protein
MILEVETMDVIGSILYFMFLLALSGAFVYLCIVVVKRVLQRLLSPRLTRIHETLKPLFDPSFDYDPRRLERSFWMDMSVVIFVCLTFYIAIFFDELFALLWDLVQAM